jgi:hypothetical protein
MATRLDLTRVVFRIAGLVVLVQVFAWLPRKIQPMALALDGSIEHLKGEPYTLVAFWLAVIPPTLCTIGLAFGLLYGAAWLAARIVSASSERRVTSAGARFEIAVLAVFGIYLMGDGLSELVRRVAELRGTADDTVGWMAIVTMAAQAALGAAFAIRGFTMVVRRWRGVQAGRG